MGGILLAVDWHIVRVALILLAVGFFTVIIETLAMLLFRFDHFSKSLVAAVMANIGSLLLGILLFLVFNKTEFTISETSELVLLYCITSIFEAFLIKLLMPAVRPARVIFTSFVMNAVSFLFLYLIFTRFLSAFFSLSAG